MHLIKHMGKFENLMNNENFYTSLIISEWHEFRLELQLNYMHYTCIDIKFCLPDVSNNRSQASYPQFISDDVVSDSMLDFHLLVQVRIVDHTEFEGDFHGSEQFVKVLYKSKGASS